MKQAEAQLLVDALGKIQVDLGALIRGLDSDYYKGQLVAIGNAVLGVIEALSQEEFEHD